MILWSKPIANSTMESRWFLLSYSTFPLEMILQISGLIVTATGNAPKILGRLEYTGSVMDGVPQEQVLNIFPKISSIFMSAEKSKKFNRFEARYSLFS